MRLEVASPAQLKRSMVISVLLLLLYAFSISVVTNMFAFYAGLIIFAHVLIGLLITCALLGSHDALLQATREGLVIHPRLGKRSLVPWSDVVSIRYYDLHHGFIMLPWLGQLRFKFKGNAPFAWGMGYLPFGWFGLYLLPARIAKGGGHAAAQFATLTKALTHQKSGAQYTVEGQLEKEALWKELEHVSLPVDRKKSEDDNAAR